MAQNGSVSEVYGQSLAFPVAKPCRFGTGGAAQLVRRGGFGCGLLGQAAGRSLFQGAFGGWAQRLAGGRARDFAVWLKLVHDP